MIELGRHIEIQLLSNDCVIVPGLGGFVASHVPARYDDDDNIFLPPLRTLGFNSKLNINDSLLIQSYSECYDISYPEALNRIERESNELKQCIQNNGYYELNDIGTLYLNDNGNIEFNPCEAGILTPSLYSLSSFGMKKRGTKDATKTDIQGKHYIKRGGATFADGTKKMSENTVNTDEVNTAIEPEDRTIRIKLSWLRNVAAVIISVFMFFAISSPVNNSDKMLKMSSMGNGIISKLITKNSETVYQNSNKKVTEKEANTGKLNTKGLETTAQKPKEATVIEPVLSDYYCIVLACHVKKSNANAYTEQLISKGFKETRVLTEEDKSTKVVYGSYKSQSEAFAALNQMQGSDCFDGAWVYHVK